jgi:ABC-type multidrug transport system fused ATPase/permease subunit
MGNFLTNLFQLAGSLTICVYGSTPFMIIPCVVIVFLCNRLRGYYMQTQREVIRIEAKTNSPIVSGFVSTISGLATVRAYRVEEDFLENQIKRIEVNKGSRISREALESWFAFRLTLLSFFISILSIMVAVANSEIDPALVGLLLSYAFNLNDDIISLTFSWANLETRMISVERIFNFMKIEPEPAYEQYCRQWSEQEEGCSKIITQGDIEFRNVSAKYRPDLPFALKHISFRIKAGEKVGIVGRTGAGKSTIYSTLLRLIDPCEGEVLLDDVDHRQYFVKDLRNAITMIDQEPVLIKGTFR